MANATDVPDMKLERRRREDALGSDLIDECRVQLMLKFRFLDLALWRMSLKAMRVGAAYPLATNGKLVVFDPPRAIARFNESFDELIRDYLHMTMHCVFRHPYDTDHNQREAWGLTCDVIAESVAMDMCAGRFESAQDAERRQALSEMRMLVGSLVPAKVYALLKGMVETPDGQHYRGLGRSTLNTWHALFERDDHASWPANSDGRGSSDPDDSDECDPDERTGDDAPDDAIVREMAGDDAPDEGGQDGSGAQMAATAQDGGDESEGEDGEASDGGEAAAEPASEEPESPDEPDSRPDVAEAVDHEHEEREWEEVAKQIEMNLETFSKEWGDQAGSLIASLSASNRRTYDYADFLRQFAAPSEEMLLNQDEFDYIYYTYGMDLYGNMPLVEPLEYKETERVRDFVIAIDTSESVNGTLVRRFVEHSLSIMKESQDFASDVNVHIVQCDARVQSDTVVTDLKDVDKVMEHFTVRGFGGTDFRPVFDYVDMLRKRGELADMKGLIYFTDGLGQFPEKSPDYDAAFVFVDDGERDIPPVPPWACKVVIDEVGINRLASKARR